MMSSRVCRGSWERITIATLVRNLTHTVTNTNALKNVCRVSVTIVVVRVEK